MTESAENTATMVGTTYRRPRLTFFVEGDTIAELRAKAIEALGLGISREQAAAHVEKLQAENSIPVIESTEVEALDAAQAAMQEHAVEALAEKVKAPRKPRGKKADATPVEEVLATAETVAADATKPQGTIAAFAQEIEKQADAETVPAKLTLESVRSAFDQYVKHFGVQAAQIDGPVLLGRVYGSSIARIKDVPEDDQGKLGRIVAAVEGAILTNEFKRDKVSA